jgi:hypothetical protein
MEGGKSAANGISQVTSLSIAEASRMSIVEGEAQEMKIQKYLLIAERD